MSSIKETSQRDIIAIVTGDSPTVVLTDITSKETPGNIQTSASKESSDKSSSGISFGPPLGIQQLVKVTPVITTYDMESISSSGTGSAISSGTSTFSSGMIGIQSKASGAIGNINPYAINNKLLLGLDPSQPIILNPTPPVVVTPVVSSRSSSATKDAAPFISEKDNAASNQNPDIKRRCVSVPAIKSEKNIWEVIDRRRAAITQKIRAASQAATSNMSENPRETEVRKISFTLPSEIGDIISKKLPPKN